MLAQATELELLDGLHLKGNPPGEVRDGDHVTVSVDGHGLTFHVVEADGVEMKQPRSTKALTNRLY